MKAIPTLGIAILIAVLMASSVAATLTFGATVLELGSDTQLRSNPDAPDDEPQAQNRYVTRSLTLRNDGTATITDLAAIFVPKGSRPSTEYNFTVSGIPETRTLAAGEEVTLTVRARVPESLDAVDSAFNAVKEEAAALRVTGKTGTTAIATPDLKVTMQTGNFLRIKDVDVCFHSKCKSTDDGDEVKDIKPGDDVEVTVVVENEYSEGEDEDLDIEDVEVSIDIDDREVRVSENEDVGDVSADSEEETSVTFEVDDDASHGTVKMVIEISGRDENGARMGEKWFVDLEIKREKHDISLDDVLLTPSTVMCSGNRNVQAQVLYRNIGRTDEDEVAIELKIPQFDIVKAERNLEVDEDDSETTAFSFSVPDDINPGQYEVQVKTYYDNTKVSDQMEKTLTLEACGDEEDDSSLSPTTPRNSRDDNGENNGVIVVQPPTAPPVVVPPRTAPAGNDKADEENGVGYLVGLGLVALVLITILVVLLVVLFRKRH